MKTVAFDFPLALYIGVPLAVATLALLAWTQVRRGQPWPRIVVFLLLRGAALLGLTALAGQPVRVNVTKSQPEQRDTVVLLVDGSASMSLDDFGVVRAAQMSKFAQGALLPALRRARLQARTFLFAEDATEIDSSTIGAAPPEGGHTNLAGGIVRALSGAPAPPVAVIALTDGAANDTRENGRALSVLVESEVPFVGIGFGSEIGVRTLALRQVVAPPRVPPRQEFNVSAQLEMSSDREMPPFDLLLLREGKVVDRKSVSAGKGQRIWLESFAVRENEEAVRTYTLHLRPPSDPGLRCLRTMATATVRISNENEFRILFAQGALSWDYRFIRRALGSDQTFQLTGLTRTAAQSYYHQNVKSREELKSGFPTEMIQLSPFRVVVLSNFKPGDLTVPQQELLKRYCGEFGGGLLVLGGSETFDPSWHNSPLEQLLPVRLDAGVGSSRTTSPFQLQVTRIALRDPIFNVSDRRTPGDVWAKLPTFDRSAPVAERKPGAQVWAEHPTQRGSDGKPRVLMAQQRYGAGTVVAIGVGNLWRWRLAKEAAPAEFDRFWRQLFRYLAQGNSQQVIIVLPDQDLDPDHDVRVLLLKPPDAKSPGPLRGCRVQIADAGQKPIKEQEVDLVPDSDVEVTFRPRRAGVYTIHVQNAQGAPLAFRSLEIQESSREFRNAARNMEHLGQWAALTGGQAIKAEDCRDAQKLIAQLETQPRRPPAIQYRRPPVGMNGGVLLLLLGCLCAEWALRKRWEMP